MAIRVVGPLLVTLVILGYFQTSMASSGIKCSHTCLSLHPQQRFCDDDVVLKVKIMSRYFVNAKNEVVQHPYSSFVRYGARVLMSLKESPFAKEDEDIFFYSPSYDCSIAVPELKDVYIIGGKVIDELLVVTSCDGIAMRFDNLTSDQRRGFKDRYEEQCGFCTIQGAGTTKYIGGDLAEDGQESGYWSPKECFYNPYPSVRYGGQDCETLYTFCRPHPDTGECAWEETMDYDDCFDARESIWFFTEKSQPAYTCRSQCMVQPTKLLRWRCLKVIKKLEMKGLIQRC
ncbi:metalloproteinase inhibitor 2 [Strongylocentrotus purpuratus]|uniref:NTR domain-containing protein n=1 Tax=Strongylocentrotus purpuratus TaxID=7668 RepID=A0A7M7RBW3_STRPU|nr:metalloproteinase inhibitor 2 [Strongylocentrotus purpuratus]